MVHQIDPRDATGSLGPRKRYSGDPRSAPRLVVRDPFTHPLAFTGLLPTAFLAFLALQLAGPALHDGTWPGLIIAAVFGTIGLWSLARFLRRWRRARRTPVTLEIGPDGLTTPGLGRIVWEDVRHVAVEVVWSSDDGGVMRRWSLLITPERGPHAGRPVRFDDELAGASLERVVDVIEAYHDVERPGGRVA